MSIRAVIVDDEKPARDRIRRLLADHADFVLVGEAADGTSAVALIDSERPDLCFLDVQMPEGDAFDVLHRVRHVPRVIFTTAYDRYAVRAFEVHSLDYLLKPFGRERFAKAIDRAREALRERAASGDDLRKILDEIRQGLGTRGGLPTAEEAEVGRPPGAPPVAGPPLRISARRGAKILLLDPSEIFWFEAEDVLVFARTEEGRFLVERPLAELESLLGHNFFRSHRRYLVNLSKVAEILPGDAGTYRIVVRDSSRSSVPLSRRQARLLRERIPW